MFCEKCKKEIKKEGIISNGKTYHIECFKALAVADKNKSVAKRIHIA